MCIEHRILLIGPPGMRLYKVAEQVINELNSEGSENKCVPFNCGEYILNSKSSLTPEQIQCIDQCRLI